MDNRFTIKVGIEPDLKVREFKNSITERLQKSPVKIPIGINVKETEKNLTDKLREHLLKAKLPSVVDKFDYDKSGLGSVLSSIKA